jgi:hypothetical protein
MKNNVIEIFANHPDGRIAYKVISTGKIFELVPTNNEVVGSPSPEEFAMITEGMWITTPVGSGESWDIDILLGESGNFIMYVEMIDAYILTEKIPISPSDLKGFESKGIVNLSEKMLELSNKINYEELEIIGRYLKYIPGIGWELVNIVKDISGRREEPFPISNEKAIYYQRKGIPVMPI